MKKKTKIIALALTLTMSLGITLGMFAYNQSKAGNVFVTAHYNNGGVCEECELEPLEEDEACTTTPSDTPCACDLGRATTSTAGGGQPCQFLWKNTIN